MANLILTLISAVVITLYLVCYIACVGRLPSSISETYYKTEKKWVFPTFLGVSLVTALVPMLELTPDNYQFLAFLTIAGLMFVAAAPAFKEDLENKVHCGGAVIAGIACLLWLILQGGTPTLAMIAILPMVIDRKRWCFYLECGLLLNLYAILIYLSVMDYIARV